MLRKSSSQYRQDGAYGEFITPQRPRSLLEFGGLQQRVRPRAHCPPADIVPPPVPGVSVTPSEAPLPPPSVQSATLALERKVKLQEKRIAELSSRLRLLKRIDLGRNKQATSPPPSVPPSDLPRGMGSLTVVRCLYRHEDS